MKKITMSSSTLVHLLLFSLFFSLFPIAKPQELDNEDEFSYIEGSPNGPEQWGEIKPEWATCSTGMMQSPIDLIDERVIIDPWLRRLSKNYKATHAALRNRGHDVMLGWKGDAGSLVINGDVYFLKQIHWHHPTEHAINGTRYELEAHMVHQSHDNKIAVIGILYKFGPPDPFLRELEDFIIRLQTSKLPELYVGVVDPNHVGIQDNSYYRYQGSLTTPPCTEGVTWTIIKKIGTVSPRQVQLLKAAVHDDTPNARPLQPINWRFIQLYFEYVSQA